MGIALANCGQAQLEELIRLYSTVPTSVAQKHILLSVGSFNSESLKRAALDWACKFETGSPKLQEFFYVFASVSGSPVGLKLTWSYFRENLELLKSKLSGANSSLMDACIQYSIAGYCSEQAAAEIEDFFKQNPMPNNARCIEQTLERIRTNAKFLKERIAPSRLKEASFWSNMPGAQKANL